MTTINKIKANQEFLEGKEIISLITKIDRKTLIDRKKKDESFEIKQKREGFIDERRLVSELRGK